MKDQKQSGNVPPMPSDWVIVKTPSFSQLMIGRFHYDLYEWEILQCHGAYKVTEWWPMPVIGTGIQIAGEDQ